MILLHWNKTRLALDLCHLYVTCNDFMGNFKNAKCTFYETIHSKIKQNIKWNAFLLYVYSYRHNRLRHCNSWSVHMKLNLNYPNCLCRYDCRVLFPMVHLFYWLVTRLVFIVQGVQVLWIRVEPGGCPRIPSRRIPVMEIMCLPIYDKSLRRIQHHLINLFNKRPVYSYP